MTVREREAQILSAMASSMTPADMPSDTLRWVAKTVGVEAAVALALELSGIPIYIPKADVTALKRRHVLRAYDGTNARELARQLGLAERTVRQWTQAHAPTEAAPSQLSLPLSDPD